MITILHSISEMLGIICGLSSTVLIVWLSYQYLIKGSPKEGMGITIGVIVGLAGIFVVRQYIKSGKKQ